MDNIRTFNVFAVFILLFFCQTVDGMNFANTTQQQPKTSLIKNLYNKIKPKQKTKNATRILASAHSKVSFYGKGFFGKLTASGSVYTGKKMTAAHKSLPFGSIVKLSYKNRSVTVKINDRGPYAPGRSLDLSPAAFKQLASLEEGVLENVKIELISLPKNVKSKRVSLI